MKRAGSAAAHPNRPRRQPSGERHKRHRQQLLSSGSSCRRPRRHNTPKGSLHEQTDVGSLPHSCDRRRGRESRPSTRRGAPSYGQDVGKCTGTGKQDVHKSVHLRAGQPASRRGDSRQHGHLRGHPTDPASSSESDHSGGSEGDGRPTVAAERGGTQRVGR